MINKKKRIGLIINYNLLHSSLLTKLVNHKEFDLKFIIFEKVNKKDIWKFLLILNFHLFKYLVLYFKNIFHIDNYKNRKVDNISFKDLNSLEFVKYTKSYNADIIFTINVVTIFKKKTISDLNFKLINIHIGDLHLYRGSFIIFHSLYNKEQFLNITSHFIIKTIDSGEIIDQITIDLNKFSNIYDIYSYAFNKQFNLLINTSKKINVNLNRIPVENIKTKSNIKKSPTILEIYRFLFNF